MKKSIYNAICIIITLAFFACLGLAASASSTPEPEPHPVELSQTETLRIWKQAVNAEYAKNGIMYRGEYNE